MNKKIYSLMLTLLALTGLMSSCSDKEDILFDHERQQFETRADRILLEYIAPFGTTAGEEIYIIGPFNGNSLAPNEEGKYETPKLDEAFKLMKAEKSNAKWGIYLDPATFQNGKTLADGFRFYSVTQGNEATLAQDVTYAVHNDNPAVGSFTNIWGQRWESYYWGADGPEIEHDGFVVYVIDETGWDVISLYQWGDVNHLNGEWPGVEPTGVQTIDGQQYKYWDMGAANTGLNQNLIFNNGGNGIQLPDFAYTIDHDLYLRVTAEGVEEVTAGPKHDGYALFILNESSQKDLALYAWGDAEAFGGWPGMAPTGTQTINGQEYVYFDLGEANTGLNLHLIPNNNNNGVQWEGDDLFFTIDHDIYVRIYDGGYEVIGGAVTPDPQPGGQTHFSLYVNNQTGWDAIALYAWGSELPELFGDWPGNNAPGTKTFAGTDYLAFDYNSVGEVYNLIFNNNAGGTQFDGPAITTGNDFYFNVTASAYEDITHKIYVDDQTGWDDMAVYAWGDGIAELYGGWPGKNVYGTETIGGVTYKVFTFPATGQVYNPIFNNNGGGSQIDGPAITLDKDYFFTVTTGSVSAKAKRR